MRDIVPGTLFIVAAPSGAGKSSIVNAALARDPRLCLSISFTSRQPRPGERQDRKSTRLNSSH